MIGYWNGGVYRPPVHWLCLYNRPVGPLPAIGFVFPHTLRRPDPHNPLRLQFLRFKTVLGQLGLFRTIAHLSDYRLPTTDYRLLPFGFVSQNWQGTGTVEHWSTGYSPSPLGLFVRLPAAV
jgi:hypothetical protein